MAYIILHSIQNLWELNHANQAINVSNVQRRNDVHA